MVDIFPELKPYVNGLLVFLCDEFKFAKIIFKNNLLYIE